VTAEQRLFAAVYHAGSLALVVSICLQIFRRIDALYPTILVVAFSRMCLAAWQLANPDCSKAERSKSGLVGTIGIWAGTVAILIWARKYGAGT
jgi:hypothetical protein